MRDTSEEIRTRLADRGAYPAVPDRWLPHLAALDEQLAVLDPGYRLAQVKVKFGGLRYYLEQRFQPECCAAFATAHPYPDTTGLDPATANAREQAWDALGAAHEDGEDHQRAEADLAWVRDQMEALIDAAEAASYQW